MEFIKKYPKLFQWLFLLIIFFALCFAIDVPETYKFIRGQAEFVKDPNQSSFVFLGKGAEPRSARGSWRNWGCLRRKHARRSTRENMELSSHLAFEFEFDSFTH